MKCSIRTTRSIAKIQRLQRQIEQAEQAARDSLEVELRRIERKIMPPLGNIPPGLSLLAGHLVRETEARLHLSFVIRELLRRQQPESEAVFFGNEIDAYLVVKRLGDGESLRVVFRLQILLEVDHYVPEDVLLQWQVITQQVAIELSQVLGEVVPYAFKSKVI